MLTAITASAQLSGGGTAQNPYIISNVDEWNYFTQHYESGKYYALGADVGPVGTIAGALTNQPFSGTFDGRGHTLTVSYSTNSYGNLAPFCVISQATIKNLRVAGSEYARTRKHIGGLVGKVLGDNAASNIDHCEVSTAISYGSGDNCGTGGFVGETFAPVNITNCVFNGSFNSPDNSPANGFSGFVGDAGNNMVKLDKCLMAASSVKVSTASTSAAFVRGSNVQASEVYYVAFTNMTTNNNATAVSSEQLASGETAYHFGWRQNLAGNNKDAAPHLFLDDSKSVLKGTFTLNGKTVLTSYGNPNQPFPLSAGIDQMSTNKAGTADATIEGLQKDKDGYYLINNKDDWNFLSYCYARDDFNGFATNVRLTADIAVNTMVGNINVAYSGTFDGQGHSLTVNYNVDNEERVAPFRTINGATITNLRTAGTVASNMAPGMASGLVGNATGNASIINSCQSNVALTFTGSGDATHGGLLGRAQAPVTFNNCAFTGSMTADNGYCVGGFVGWAEQHVDINNCLMAANIKVQPSGRGNDGNAAFGRNNQQYTINNSYALNFANNDVKQGDYTNEADLKSGAIAYRLQNNGDKPIWGQNLGTDPMPVPIYSSDNRVYKADYVNSSTGATNVIGTVYATRGTAFPRLTFDPIVACDYTDAPASSDKTFTLQSTNNSTIILNKADWDKFASTYDGGTDTYALAADINDAVSTMVEKTFRGTFDGRGHMLNVVYYRDEERVAPFRRVDGATIKNLHTAGYLQSANKYCGGIAGEALGATSYFDDCQSSVRLDWWRIGNLSSGRVCMDESRGGIVGLASTDVVINNCLFDGALLDRRPNEYRSINTGGFVGWSAKSVTIKNSWMTAQIQSVRNQNTTRWGNASSATFARGNGVTIENCYWTADNVENNDYRYTHQGTRIDGNDKLASGELAALLQGSQTEPHWGQTITGDQLDTRPLLTSNLDKVVCMATFKAGNDVKGTSIVNRGKYFTVPDISGYDMLYDNNQPATRNIVVALFQKDANGFYTINNRDDWDNFAAYYKGTGNYRLGADINGITTMACTSDRNPFKGTFDGAGHTLTVNYTSDEQRVAPFRYINGATITNLRTAGSITGSHISGMAGGLAGDAIGNESTISNCLSTVDLTFTGEGDATHGGFLGIADAPVTFNNCAFTGSLTAEKGNAVAGYVGWTTKAVKINDCLVAARVNVPASGRGEQGNAGFGRNWKNYTVTNSYVVRFDNVDVNQGTYITDEQVKSGEMAHMLQGTQGQQYWGQTLGTDNKPVLTGDNAKHVYKAAFTFEGDEVAAVYANTNNNFPQLTSLKYVSADPDNYASQTASNDITVTLNLFEKDNDNWLIKNVEDWNIFAAYATKGNFRLDANLDSVTTMAGTNEKPFTGTFDGAGHTLNVNYTFDEPFVAPFRYVKGATFRNLNVTGTEHITADDKNHCSGLLGSADGATIERCTSSVALTFDNAGDAHSGGFVGHAQHSTIVIRDCAFTGSFTQAAGNNASVGGLIGWGENDCKADISNSYVDMTLTGITGQNNLVRANNRWNANASNFSNCFYTVPAGIANNFDPEPAELVTREQMQSGYVANLLQNAHATDNSMVWGQNITGDSKDAHPVITSETGKRVYKASFTFEDDELAAVYANSGKTFPELTSLKYASADPEEYAAQTASNDITVTLNLFEKDNDYLLIKDIEDWNNFAAYATKGDFHLGTSLDNITTMVGKTDKPFTGTFDGQGHTLTVNYAFSGKPDNEQADAAPFRYVNGATIKNLRTAGIVTTSKGTSDASGLVGDAYGAVTIDNCASSASITYDGTGDGTNGGLIGRVNDNSSATLTNCAFTGSITSARGNCFGGLIGWVNDKNASATITNSLVAADINVQGANNNVGNAPFARNATRSTVTNSYYRDFANISEVYRAGDKVTAEQLASGEVAFKLQSSQDSLYWGQTVGTDNVPQLTADADKRVEENVYDGDDSKTYDNFVVINEDKGNRPNITAHADATGRVKLVRKFAEGWNTLVLPFSLTTDEVEEAFGADTKVAYFTNTEQNAIELSTKTDGDKNIDANTPVIIKPSKVPAEIDNIIFAGKAIADAVEATVDGRNGIRFMGSYNAECTVMKGDYFINNTTLWKSTGNTTLKATRAYFAIPEAAAGAKITLYINEDGGTTTGTTAVTVDGMGDNSSTSAVYTLSGQKIADSLEAARRLHLQSGVYIVNGKKIVIK